MQPGMVLFLFKHDKKKFNIRCIISDSNPDIIFSDSYFCSSLYNLAKEIIYQREIIYLNNILIIILKILNNLLQQILIFLILTLINFYSVIARSSFDAFQIFSFSQIHYTYVIHKN